MFQLFAILTIFLVSDIEGSDADQKELYLKRCLYNAACDTQWPDEKTVPDILTLFINQDKTQKELTHEHIQDLIAQKKRLLTKARRDKNNVAKRIDNKSLDPKAEKNLLPLGERIVTLTEQVQQLQEELLH